MNTATGEYLSCAETAKLVRQALKSNFPGVKFSVRSDVYAGGASIRVGWIDGPVTREVKAVVAGYEGADFDGMQDLKTSREATVLAAADGSLRTVSFGADFIFCDREHSPEVYRAAAERVAERFGFDLSAAGELRVYESFRFKGRQIAGGFASDLRVANANEYLSTLVYRELRS